MGISLAKRLFTVGEFYRMAEAGIFGEDDRVELLQGEIVEMSPIGSRHAGCVKRLNRLFSERLQGRVVVGVQDPVRLDDYSEPQPDLAILRPRADDYADAHPGPEDVLLVIEVAETSAEIDREVKIPLYAKSGIPEAWLVNLPFERIEIHSNPSPQGYQQVRYCQGDQRLSSPMFPDLEWTAAAVLGSR